LWATRVPLEACSACVYPDMFSLATAQESFSNSGNLKDTALEERLKNMLKGYIRHVELLSADGVTA
jgi:hypothetical protein